MDNPNGTIDRNFYLFGIDEVYRYLRTYITEQSCGGINVQRCSDDDEYIGFFGDFDSRLYHGYGFAEPYDVGSQLVSVSVGFVGFYFIMVGRQFINAIFIFCRAYFGEFSVQMNYVSTPGAFV